MALHLSRCLEHVAACVPAFKYRQKRYPRKTRQGRGYGTKVFVVLRWTVSARPQLAEVTVHSARVACRASKNNCRWTIRERGMERVLLL